MNTITTNEQRTTEAPISIENCSAGRIKAELEAAQNATQAVLSQVKSRLITLVQREFQTMLDETLASIHGTWGASLAPQSGNGNGGPNGGTIDYSSVPHLEDLLAQVYPDGANLLPASFNRPSGEIDPHTSHPASPNNHEDSSRVGDDAGPAIDAVPSAFTQVDDLEMAELYEGTVRLSVEGNGNVQEVFRFVDELSRRPELRVLQLVGNHRHEGVVIWLGLTEPLCLKIILGKMDGVSKVTTPLGCGPKGNERLLEVCLA